MREIHVHWSDFSCATQHAGHPATLRLSTFAPEILTEANNRRKVIKLAIVDEGRKRFVMSRIAGHSSISITQRYIHPQADAISRVFSQVGAKLGTDGKTAKRKARAAGKQLAAKSA